MQAQCGFPHRLRAVDTLPGKTGHSKAMYRSIVLMYIYIRASVESTRWMRVGRWR